MKQYIINPKYILRGEKQKTYILTNPKYEDIPRMYVIHPIYAMLMSFCKGKSLEDTVADIKNYFYFEKETIENLLFPLIENKDYIKKGESMFPPNMVIEYSEGMEIPQYKPEDFKYENLNLRISRLESPTDIICNVTMKCYTSCVYCYADRNSHQKDFMPIELLEKIIKEAKEIGVLRFQLMGGEVFLYKDWKRLMKLMSQMEYQPLISTKIPMRKEHIDIIKDLNLNIRPIQFSLDTMIKDHLYKILNIKDSYYDDVLNMFSLLEENKVDYVIHSVISRFNDSIDDIKSLIDFFSDKHYLKKWMLDPAKCSMYNGREYSSYKTTIEKLNAVIECIDKSIANGQITYDVEKPKPIVNMNSLSIEKKAKSFADRTMCTANLNALYILPDGKVTVCEELYWHPRFLLGDLTKQSIKEIWNSQKAKDLFFLKQESLQESSPCRTCEEFKECREYKHICWRETILAYGKDKWDYPDIRCPKAPPIERDISL